jgi:hypothetical protein
MASDGSTYVERKIHASMTDIQNDTIVFQDRCSNIAWVYTGEDAHL